MNTRNPFEVGAHPGGMILGSTPGRADRVPMKVANGSFVIPADIPSALGQGNSESGAEVLSRMFKIGPYGSGMTGHLSRPPAKPAQLRNMQRRHGHADGGEVEAVDVGDGVGIQASHGEFLVDPETVREIGHGSLAAGHKVLHRFVLKVRKEHIAQLKNLKGPKV